MVSVRNFFLIAFLSFLSFHSTGKKAAVKSVIDGDTFILSNGEKVRMIGINSTEREEWYYYEAREYLRSLIQGRQVELQTDNRADNKDIHGRLLRYVYIGDRDINKEMIETGHAYAFLRYPFDKKSEYRNAEKRAKSQKIGLWSSAKSQNEMPHDSHPSTESTPITYWIILVVIAVLVILGTFFYFR